MTRTSQLDAHYAVLQLDALREKVVMSFRPTADMLIAEFHEKYAGLPADSPRVQLAHEMRVEQLVRYRAAVLELAAAIVVLRCNCGTNLEDLPHVDPDVTAEYSRLRAKHEAYRRVKAGEPADDDVDDMVDRHHEALVDYATREGGGE